jgi:hypothetical protein
VVVTQIWFNPRREAVVVTDKRSGHREWLSCTRPPSTEISSGDSWVHIEARWGPRRRFDLLRRPLRPVTFDPDTHTACRRKRP